MFDKPPTLDFERGELTVGGIVYNVTEREFEFLSPILTSDKFAASYEKIVGEIWPLQPDTPPSAKVTMSQLRTRVNKYLKPHGWSVENIPGRGYKLTQH